MRIGRDHIASTVYTIAFATAGASLSVLLLIAVYDRPLLQVLQTEQFAGELIRTLVGSIGLVLAVPLTTAIGVAVVRASNRGRSAAAGGGRRPRRRSRSSRTSSPHAGADRSAREDREDARPDAARRRPARRRPRRSGGAGAGRSRRTTSASPTCATPTRRAPDPAGRVADVRAVVYDAVGAVPQVRDVPAPAARPTGWW